MHLISLLPLASLACLAAYVVASAAYSLFFSRHRNIPGPLLARFSKLYYFYQVYRGHFEQVNAALHRLYSSSPIVRIAPDWFSINDPSALKQIYGIGSKFTKGDWYAGWQHPDPNRYTLFTDRNIQRHAQDRKKFASIYSMSAMVNYEQYVDDCAGVFVERLNEAADSNTVLDMAHWFQCYAFDVIGKITYSKRFGFLDRGEDVGGLLAALASNMVFSTLSGIYARFHPLSFAIAEVLGGGAKARNFLLRFTDDKWSERQKEQSEKDIEVEEESGKPIDMLAKFHNELKKGKPGWTGRDVMSMSMSNVVAGSDTTSLSLTSVLGNLLKYPETLQRLRDEIDEFESKGLLEETSVSFKESQKMTYLQAVIKEGLRMHPAPGLPLWRVVPEGGAQICDHWFKAGDVVGVNPWVIQYDASVFGEDAVIFKPERWLDEKDKEKLKAMERSWIPFGMGSRACIGKNVSLLEMGKLIPQIVRQFDFNLQSPDVYKTDNFWFVKPYDFNVKVTRRNLKA